MPHFFTRHPTTVQCHCQRQSFHDPEINVTHSSTFGEKTACLEPCSSERGSGSEGLSGTVWCGFTEATWPAREGSGRAGCRMVARTRGTVLTVPVASAIVTKRLAVYKKWIGHGQSSGHPRVRLRNPHPRGPRPIRTAPRRTRGPRWGTAEACRQGKEVCAQGCGDCVHPTGLRK